MTDVDHNIVRHLIRILNKNRRKKEKKEFLALDYVFNKQLHILENF